MMEIVVIISIIVISAFCYYTFNKTSEQNKMSFKESSDLVGLPIVTFYSNNYKLHFLLDTGADSSLINSKVIEYIPHKLTDEYINMLDVNGHQQQTQLSETTLYYNGKAYDGTFQVCDLSTMSNNIDLRVKGKQIIIAGIIGNDFFKKYQYVLDFQKLIAYSKK